MGNRSVVPDQTGRWFPDVPQALPQQLISDAETPPASDPQIADASATDAASAATPCFANQIDFPVTDCASGVQTEQTSCICEQWIPNIPVLRLPMLYFPRVPEQSGQYAPASVHKDCLTSALSVKSGIPVYVLPNLEFLSMHSSFSSPA